MWTLDQQRIRRAVGRRAIGNTGGLTLDFGGL
jgi:hypothetical protein